MKVLVDKITCDNRKKDIAQSILQALPQWFGIEKARQEYVDNSQGKDFWCAYDDALPVGFVYIKSTSRHTVELAVIGILQEYHRRGIGKKLFDSVKAYAQKQGYSFIQVKTVQMGKYTNYDNTNNFYLSLGFKELEVFPTLWDENNPCLIYVMSI